MQPQCKSLLFGPHPNGSAEDVVGALRQPQREEFCLRLKANAAQGIAAGSSSHPQCKAFRCPLKPAAVQGFFAGAAIRPEPKAVRLPFEPDGSARRFAGGSTQSQREAFCLRLAQPRCKAFALAPVQRRSAMDCAGASCSPRRKHCSARLNAAAVQGVFACLSPQRQ